MHAPARTRLRCRPARRSAAVPQPDGRSKRVRGGPWSEQLGRSHCVLEIRRVETNRCRAQAESTAAGDDGSSHNGPQSRHVAAQCPIGARRRIDSPEGVDQGVRADMVVRMSRQHPQNDALVGAGRRDIPTVDMYLDGPEDPHVHGQTISASARRPRDLHAIPAAMGRSDAATSQTDAVCSTSVSRVSGLSDRGRAS